MHERTDSGVAFAHDSTTHPKAVVKDLDTPEINLFRQKGNLEHQDRPPVLNGNGATMNGHSSTISTSSHVKGPPFPEIVPTVWESFVASATAHPDLLAVSSIHQKGELYSLPNLRLDHASYEAAPYVRWSYSSLIQIVTQLIGALEREGAREGFPIFAVLDNVAEYPLIMWAGASLGCTIIPLHPRILLNKEEASHVLTKAISTSSFEEAIIFVRDAEIGTQILDLGILYQTRIFALERQDASEPSAFEQLLAAYEPFSIANLTAYKDKAANWTLVIFTSGTTALPKGVVLNAFRLDRWMAKRNNMAPPTVGDSALVNLPNNHAFWHVTGLSMNGSGGAIVLSGSTFSPHYFPELMKLEQCTHLPMPPALIHAVVEVTRPLGIKYESLKRLSLGGAKLSIEFVKDCFEVLGAQSVDIMYGQTENFIAATTGGFSDVTAFVHDDDISVGWTDLGAELKVCAPGKTDPLPRNTIGELHYGSVIRCDGYAGEAMPENFYDDDQGQKWFATGDAATIDDDGLVFIVGRIKDMIIRGAVNISPAAIEFLLAQEPRTKPLNIQIVGKLDEIAGEVPVAVSQKAITEADITAINETILQYKGPVYLPEEVLTLEQLGLDDYPKTMLGKVQKGKVAATVRAYLSQRDAPKVNDHAPDELASKVQKVWKRTIGHEVDMYAKVSDFADSITIMRIRDRFARDLGIKLTFADILSSKTVKDQIELVRDQSHKSKKDRRQIETGEVTVMDMVHLRNAPQLFPPTVAYICDELGKFRLTWADVQYVAPASDFTQVLTQADILNTSWSFKFAFVVKAGMHKAAVRGACERLIANNNILTSFLFSNKQAFGSDQALHVVLKPTEQVFNNIFHDLGSVRTKEEFTHLVFNPYEYQMTMLPGILFQILLFDIEESGQVGMIFVVHHAMIDASYMQLIFDDLDKALGEQQLEDHISYKIWADSYYSLRNTHEAQVAASWHVNRLDDLVSHKASIFPQLPRPHHYLLPEMHIQKVDDNGYHTNFHAKGLTNLRRQHPHLSAPVIIKAAWSLMNIHHNNTSTAIFSNLQADRRRFPFVPKALESLPGHDFSASNVAGICLQDVINIIPLHPEESVLDFLTRIHLDQEDLNEYAAAPLRSILSQVGPVNAEIMLDIFRSQIFNWTPGLGAMQTHNPNENYEPVASFIRPSLRLVINVDVGGLDDETVFAQIKSPPYDAAGLKRIADDFEDLVLWVCDEGNWGRRSGDLRQGLRKADAVVGVNGQVNGHANHIM